MKGKVAGETIIAEGVKVEGDFKSQGNVVIEGHVSGNVSAAGDITIGERAQIDADVAANSAVISGTVQGNIRIEERLELTATANVAGDIEARVLQIAAGSTLNGSVKMAAGAAPQKKAVEEEV